MNFNCPYCRTHTTILDGNSIYYWNSFYGLAESTQGRVGVAVYASTCPNLECKKLYLICRLSNKKIDGNEGATIRQWELMPESSAVVLPEYIPKAIQEDYYEACRIRDLSPKASATLARRCLQGMIRDFHGIKKSTLKEEIDSLEGVVLGDVWDSIDAVRQIGNIGAHMEKDIDVIVDVEPEEAQLLIELIEQLIDEWYVSRYQTQLRAEKIKAMAAEKKVQRNGV